LKVPRHCQLVLLAEVRTFERLKVSEVEFVTSRGKTMCGVFTQKARNFNLKVARAIDE
jgi:hypothetical protein